jgi:hypothetical protein
LLCGLDRGRQDRDQFVGLAGQGIDIGIHHKLGVLDKLQPVERFAHLLVRDTHFVNEIGATFRTARLLVVRSTTGRRPHQLPEDVLRSWSLRKRLA